MGSFRADVGGLWSRFVVHTPSRFVVWGHDLAGSINKE